MKSNGNLSDIVSMSEMTAGHHNLEEGDQLVLLNAIDVMHKDKNAKLYVFSVDTDVLVLLTGTYPLLPPMTCLLRKKGERIPIWESYHKLGREREREQMPWWDGMPSKGQTTWAHLLERESQVISRHL